MGYSTDFEGSIKIDPPLSETMVAVLQKFCDAEHDRSTMPGVYCDLEVSEDGTEIKWDYSEKTNDLPEWFAYIIKNITHDYTMNGTMEAAGEDVGDRWYLHVRDNKVFTEDAIIMPSGNVELVGEDSEDAPIALPDENGLRVLNHLQLGEYIGDYLKDLGGDAPEEVVKVFRSLFDYPITVNADGTFTIDEDI